MHGYGKGWHRWRPKMAVPPGYTYIGPCRCGTGPHAFYQDPSGRTVHASQLHIFGLLPSAETEDLRAKIESLKEEKAQLEKRVEKLEEQLREKTQK